jgi:hypothetical protein
MRQMKDALTYSPQATLLYRVIVPVRGIADGDHASTLSPQGALLEILPDDSGNPLVCVRCNGRNHCVLEHDLMQWCERPKWTQSANR